MQHLVIIDGLSFLFRAYYAVRPLTRADGLHTNALFGFAQMLIKVVKDLRPDQCVVALDSIGPTFRDNIYKAYKAHRQEPDPEMLEQMPHLEPLIRAFDIPGLRVEGVEADDIIATLVARHRNDRKITIVSSDKDLMQLLGGEVRMLDTMKAKTFGPDEVREKFGVGPDKVIEVQALIGDSSDNIPGVPGIGPKTAAQLIGDFGTLENLYDHLADVKRDKLRDSLKDNKEAAFISKQLVTLKDDVALDVSDAELAFQPDLRGAVEFLDKMEFRTLAERLRKNNGERANGNGHNGGGNNSQMHDSLKHPQGEGQGNQLPEGNVDIFSTLRPGYDMVTTREAFSRWLDAGRQAGRLAVDTETDHLNPMVANLVGLSLSVDGTTACYVPLAHRGDLLGEKLDLLDTGWVLSQLHPLLVDPTIRIIGHNIKYDLLVLARALAQLSDEGEAMAQALLAREDYDDTMVMSFCLDGGRHGHGMDLLAKEHLDHTPIAYKDVCGTGKKQITFDMVPLTPATNYAAEDALITARLYDLFARRLAAPEGKRLWQVYERIEKPLIGVLAAMERTGVLVDRTQLLKLSEDFGARMAAAEARIHELAGETFNVNSPKQLGEVLFDKLELAVKGRNAKRSTNVAVLEELAEAGHEIAKEVLKYRSVMKLRSTYSEALMADINPTTGRVHTSYNQTGAATGRLSSAEPNLQNIPIRTEDGRKIRHAFVAPDGWRLVSADYSQIELRLLAHVSEAPKLVEAFNNDHDIHAYTAALLFDVPEADVTNDQRRVAKTINFGLIYGMGPVSLARQLDMPRKDAEDFIGRYFARYEGVRAYMDGAVAFVREHGYVETPWGRRVHLPDIHSSQPQFKAGAERAAINAPLQGGNADIIKMVMPRVRDALVREGLAARMLLQVHDELIFEVPNSEVEATQQVVRDVMETVVSLKVPLKVGIGVGDNWEDAH